MHAVPDGAHRDLPADVAGPVGTQLSFQESAAQVSFLLRVKEFAQYLYEEEERRAGKFNEATKTYLLFIGSTLAGTVGALQWANIRPVAFLLHRHSAREMVIVLALLIAVIALGLSFLMTVLVIKVRNNEHLCKPSDFLGQVFSGHSEADTLERTIANFIVAAERNAAVNDKKGSLLASASRVYRVALVGLTVACLVYTLV
jgi:hypothetical protein